MPGVLRLRSKNAGRIVSAERTGEVPDVFWLLSRSEWGSAGPRPDRALEIPAERFLERLGWLASACRAYGVSLDWDAGSAAMVARYRAERKLLPATLAHPTVLSKADARRALRDTRWTQERELRGFQLRDLGVLLGLPHGANFSVPGAGKTAVTLALYEAERSRDRVEQLLVIAPLSAFESWRDEAKRWLAPPPCVHPFDGTAIPDEAEILLVNHPRILSSYEAVAAWTARCATQVVLDEAHRIKRGRSGEWGSAALDIGLLATRRDILTGTPAPQGPRDLGALLDFLWWGRGHQVLPPAALAADPTDAAIESVAESIRPLFVRTTKRDLRLPKMRTFEHKIPLTGLQREIYLALRSQFEGTARMSRLERSEWARMGQVVMYLLEAATNPGLLPAGSTSDDPLEFIHPPLAIPPDSTLGELVAAYGTYETPPKLAALAEILHANRMEGRKTLVWSNFVRSLQLMERTFSALQPAVVHGGIPSEVSDPAAIRTREAELQRFRTDGQCWVLLANPAAMAEGISLHQACQDAVYLERTFNAGQYLQSVDRIHRLGLKKEVRITFMVTEETIDEVVADRVETKAKRLFKMLKDSSMLTMTLPDEEQVGDPLDSTDVADLTALFAHLRGEFPGA